jgi:hypothetical protein
MTINIYAYTYEGAMRKRRRQDRLLCGQEHLRHIVERNIVCADGLSYKYLFGEPERFGNDLFEFC